MSEQEHITIAIPDAAAIGAEVAPVTGGASTPTIRDDAERMAVSERIGQCKRVLKQIKTLRQLYVAALARRSVTCPHYVGFHKPKPAAFVISMQGTMILRMIEKGLYFDQPRTRRAPWGKAHV